MWFDNEENDYDVLDENYDLYDLDDDDDEEEPSMPFSELMKQCIKPTVYDASINISRLFLLCIIFRIFAQHCNIPLVWKHAMSTVLGIYAMYYYFDDWVGHMIMMVIGFYILIRITPKTKGLLILFLSFSFLIANELEYKEAYTKVRGSEMLLAMKFVSVAFDVQESMIVYKNKMRCNMPSFLEFTGYSFCVGTCIFGPWITYIEYANIYKKVDLTWAALWKIVRSLVCAVIFFLLSMCLLEWGIPDSYNGLFLLYRDALLFRCGHYFVSYLSDTTISLIGYSTMHDVCQPRFIEFPRSLNLVVIYWNVSMHRWLKHYVFRTSSAFGRFTSVFITFVVSALMHGLNYQLAGVLISLGFYTYVEFTVRKEAADKMDACVSARTCPIPCHMHSNRNIWPAAVFNAVCSIVVMYHLAYLGVIVDTSTNESIPFERAFDRWYDLNFISHWVALLTFFVYMLIK